jgi:hypothetical protein
VACKSTTEAEGTSYIIPAAEIVKTPGAKYRSGFPAVEVWWSRSSRDKSEETLIIRQEYPDRKNADVLELTFGQAYDLIDALTKAVENS